MSVLRTLFKVSQLRNYFLKKFNTLIFDALNAQFSIKVYYLKSLKNILKTFVNIFLYFLFYIYILKTIREVACGALAPYNL